MKLSFLPISVTILILLAASGCTSQQAYQSGQACQRTKCNKMVDESERERCLSRADVPYEDYKRETQNDKK